MFKNTLSLYIDHLLIMKDEEININFLLTNDVFIKYLNNEVNKEYLLDEHTKGINYLWNGVRYTNINNDY